MALNKDKTYSIIVGKDDQIIIEYLTTILEDGEQIAERRTSHAYSKWQGVASISDHPQKMTKIARAIGWPETVQLPPPGLAK